MNSPDNKLNRREFLHRGAVVAAGSAALSNTALSYTRIAGANDRISLGHIGVGNRGSSLLKNMLKVQRELRRLATCSLC